MTDGGYSRAPRFDREIDAATWRRWLLELGTDHDVVDAKGWHTAFADECQPGRFSAGWDDLRMFVVTFLHETAMLKRMEENLNYSAERLCEVWPNRFPNIERARIFEYRPQALANLVYGGRMGNTAPNDGWDFRGRASGITGRTNYTWLADRWGQDLTTSGGGDLIVQPHFALEASFYVWEGIVPDKDLHDQVKVRKVYNGGVIGLEHCRDLAHLCERIVVRP